MSDNHADVSGANNPNFGKLGVISPNYKDGKKLAQARGKAKRRNFGSTFLLVLQPEEVGHHISNECIIGIPEEAHQRFGGRSRKRHRALVLDWLKNNDTKKYKLCISVLETLSRYI